MYKSCLLRHVNFFGVVNQISGYYQSVSSGSARRLLTLSLSKYVRWLGACSTYVCTCSSTGSFLWPRRPDIRCVGHGIRLFDIKEDTRAPGESQLPAQRRKRQNTLLTVDHQLRATKNGENSGITVISGGSVHRQLFVCADNHAATTSSDACTSERRSQGVQFELGRRRRRYDGPLCQTS